MCSSRKRLISIWRGLEIRGVGGRGRGLYAPNLSAPLLICVSQQYKIICKKYVKVAIFRDLGQHTVYLHVHVFFGSIRDGNSIFWEPILENQEIRGGGITLW